MAAFGTFASQAIRATFFFRNTQQRVFSMATYWQPQTAIVGTTVANVLEIANGFQGTGGTLMKELMDTGASVVNCHAEWYGILGDGYIDAWSNGGEWEGARGGVGGGEDILANVVNALPDYVALEIQRRTSLAGRQNRGRVFMPCISEYVQDDGYLHEDAVVNANAVAAFLSTSLVIGAFTMNARHWNRKDHLLVPVTQARVMTRLVTRNDRKARSVNLPTS